MRTLLEIPTHDGHTLVLEQVQVTSGGGLGYKMFYRDYEGDYAVVTYSSRDCAGVELIERLEKEAESAELAADPYQGDRRTTS